MRSDFYLHNLDHSLRVKPIIKSVGNLIDFKVKVIAPETMDENRIQFDFRK